MNSHNTRIKKGNVVAGLGEIGKPIFYLISKSKTPVYGYDINPKIMKKFKQNKKLKITASILHICIPFSEKLIKQVFQLVTKFNPDAIVIHSTVSPKTTRTLQKKFSIPVIYSPVRGVHKRMKKDLKRYTKFYANCKNTKKSIKAEKQFLKLMKKCGIKTKKISNPETLELAKILVDTSYYGWLINYSQITNMIAKKYGVDYDEMWSFADEIQKFLGNRPKMYPGIIGGHCVIPNLSLIDEQKLWHISKINNLYSKNFKSAKRRHKNM